MIEYELFIKILLMLYVISGIGNIIVGATKSEKSTNHGTLNVIAGIIQFLVVIAFLVL